MGRYEQEMPELSQWTVILEFIITNSSPLLSSPFIPSHVGFRNIDSVPPSFLHSLNIPYYYLLRVLTTYPTEIHVSFPVILPSRHLPPITTYSSAPLETSYTCLLFPIVPLLNVPLSPFEKHQGRGIKFSSVWTLFLSGFSPTRIYPSPCVPSVLKYTSSQHWTSSAIFLLNPASVLVLTPLFLALLWIPFKAVRLSCLWNVMVR